MVANDQMREQNQTTYVLMHGRAMVAGVGSGYEKHSDTGHQAFTPTVTGLCKRSHLNSAALNLSAHIADVVNLPLR
jgi:hypothetical protein